MNVATMKVHGDADSVADVRDGLPSEPDSSWKKGDLKPNGRVRIDHGFYVSIGVDANPNELLKQIRSYLAECEARGIHFERSDVAAELRIVYDAAPGTEAPTLDFALADMKLLVQMGITLSIAA